MKRRATREIHNILDAQFNQIVLRQDALSNKIMDAFDDVNEMKAEMSARALYTYARMGPPFGLIDQNQYTDNNREYIRAWNLFLHQHQVSLSLTYEPIATTHIDSPHIIVTPYDGNIVHSDNLKRVLILSPCIVDNADNLTVAMKLSNPNGIVEEVNLCTITDVLSKYSYMKMYVYLPSHSIWDSTAYMLEHKFKVDITRDAF